MSQHAVLSPAGPQSGSIAELYWFFLWVAIIVWAVVITALLIGSFRSKITGDSKLKRTVVGATAVTTVILMGLLVSSIVIGGGVAESPGPNPLSIDVVGHQWWWEVHYPDQTPSQTVITANEIHIPVGKPVKISLTSHDVIHSFWVPSLHGKTDLIPTRINTIYIQADHPGIYRGQCAEFCGLEHARMAMYVIAEDPKIFEARRAAQLQPGAEPGSTAAQRGREVFTNGPCVLCHTVRGTNALASFGPDLTHIASRGSIAAGTLSNNRGNLAGWITNAQHIKPGNNMPSINIAAADLQPLAEYLESLK